MTSSGQKTHLPGDQMGSSPSTAASKQIRATWTKGLSRFNLACILLLIVTCCHAVGLYVFTKGFLLTRLSIPTVSPPYSPGNPLPMAPTHKKAVILIIDALRTDFISPYHPSPPSAFHHGVLSLPAQLTAERPEHSLLFNSFSDPPTTTMQRIKGITTGSLPTFVDAGANFASTAIEEDSLIFQLVTAGKKVGFMGDDTWQNLFPTSFALSHPYDSFNVEDLHSVDNGVISHLFPYLHPSNTSRWDVLIGHFLGVDHVGHRVGPERDLMYTKLKQMDGVLRDVVRQLDDDTLLVVLGDHGMDGKGNHGGDSELETSAALWMYSKSRPLTHRQQDAKVAASWPTYRFPGTAQSIRHINQIDLVPTVALLLGIPIPYNNLGSVIPECFTLHLSRLEQATRINAYQILNYIEAYGNDQVDRSLAVLRAEAVRLADNVYHTVGDRNEALRTSIAAHTAVSREALSRLRALWAQFSISAIVAGLALLALSVPMLLALYFGIRKNGPNWDTFARLALETTVTPALAGGMVAAAAAGIYTRTPILALEAFVAATVGIFEMLFSLPLLVNIVSVIRQPRLASFGSLSLQRAIGPIIMILHAVSFASNSFIMWEDRMVVFLLNTIPCVYLLKAMTAPMASLRLRTIGLSCALIAIVRIIGTVTICREEQQPYCRVTFYQGSQPVAPIWVLVVIIPLALQLPRFFGLTLDRSKSLGGPARFFLGTAWRGCITANAVYWVLEWLEAYEGLKPERVPLVKLVKLCLARASAVCALIFLPYYWATTGLCIQVVREVEQTGEEKPVTVYGFANAYGSTYLLFLLIPFAMTHLVSQPVAQLTLIASLVVVIVHIELIDTKKDGILLSQSFASSANPGAFERSAQSNVLVRPSFTDTVPLILLGFLGFFATGHQAVLTSIQWKAAFVGFNTVTYPFSPLLVVINTWGPVSLSALAVPLLALWNISPRPNGSIPLLAHSLQLGIVVLIYHSCVTLASAVCSAWLRRHLMVWKVFAPRFMLAGCTLLIIDLSVLMALAVGVRLTSWKVWRTFKCATT